MESLISSYGYIAVLVGTFLEGETILVLAGFAAHRGFLALHWVIAAAFAGTLAGDQLYYYLGRLKGVRLLERKPVWRAKARRVLDLLESHETLVILGFRFLYGIRTVAPFVIGMSRVSPSRYLLLNSIGAALWAISIGVLGYVFGHALELFLGDLKRYETMAFLALAGLGGIVWAVYLWKTARAKDQAG